MALFLIVSIPMWFLMIVAFYPVPSRGWRGILTPFLGGVLTGSVCLLVTLSLLTRLPFSTELLAMYIWAWLRGPGLPMLISIIVVIILQYRQPTYYSRTREIAAWLSGAATTYTLWYALTPNPGFDIYRLFFIPVLFISAVGSVSWIADRALRLKSYFGFVLLLIAALFSSIITMLPVLYAFGSEIEAWIVTSLIAFGSTLLTFMDSRGWLA